MEGSSREPPTTVLRKAVQQPLQARKKHDFHAFCANIRVRCATKPEYGGLPKIQNEKEIFARYLTFTLRLNPGFLKLTLSVRMPREPKANKYFVEQIGVQFFQEWMPVAHFLDTILTAPFFSGPVGEKGYEMMWRWYNQDQKKFRFMELPKELRLIIYEFAIGGDVYPHGKLMDVDNMVVMLGGWIPKAPDDRLEGTHDPADEICAPNTAILCLSTQIRKEVLDGVLGSTRKSFEDYDTLAVLVQHVPIFPMTLRHMGLNLSNKDYLMFFGAYFSQHGLEFRQPQFVEARILEKTHFPNLARLDIKFRSTRWEPLDSPCAGLYQHEWVIKQGAGWSCQKIISVMILSLALEYVYHIKEVNVEGYIKTSIRKAYQNVLKEYKENLEKGLSFSMTEEAMPGLKMPPRCKCSTPCRFWGIKVLFDPARQRQGSMTCKSADETFKKYKFDYGD